MDGIAWFCDARLNVVVVVDHFFDLYLAIAS